MFFPSRGQRSREPDRGLTVGRNFITDGKLAGAATAQPLMDEKMDLNISYVIECGMGTLASNKDE